MGSLERELIQKIRRRIGPRRPLGTEPALRRRDPQGLELCVRELDAARRRCEFFDVHRDIGVIIGKLCARRHLTTSQVIDFHDARM